MLPTTYHGYTAHGHHPKPKSSQAQLTSTIVLMFVCFILGAYMNSVFTIGPGPTTAALDAIEVTQPRTTLQVASSADAEPLNTAGIDERQLIRKAPSSDAGAGAPNIFKHHPSEVLPPVRAPDTVPMLGDLNLPEADRVRITKSLANPLLPVGNSHYTVYPHQVLSWYPRAMILSSFISDEEADHIIGIAEKRLAPSGLAFKPGDDPEKQRDVRTSTGTFLTRRDDKAGVLGLIEERIAEVLMIPVSHGEAFNLLRYEKGQRYESHYDAFRPQDYGPHSNDRYVTVLFFLSNVEEGGQTIFPLEGKDGLQRKNKPGFSYKSCDQGVKVQPRKGDALVFWDMNVDNTYDDHSLHGACPVVKGVKYTMAKWIRNKPMGAGTMA